MPLDYQAFPHLFVHIVDIAPYSSLLALRTTNHSICRAIDEILFRHVIVSPPRGNIGGVSLLQAFAPYRALPFCTPHVMTRKRSRAIRRAKAQARATGVPLDIPLELSSASPGPLDHCRMLVNTTIVDYYGLRDSHHRAFPLGSFPHLRVVRRNLDDPWFCSPLSMMSVDDAWERQKPQTPDLADHRRSLTYVDFTTQGHWLSADISHRNHRVVSLFHSAPVRRVINVKYPQGDQIWGLDWSYDFCRSPHDSLGELILVLEPGEVIVPSEDESEAGEFDDFDGTPDPEGTDEGDNSDAMSVMSWGFELGPVLEEMEEWAVDPVPDLGQAMEIAIRWATHWKFVPNIIWDEDFDLELEGVETWAVDFDHLDDFDVALDLVEEWALDYDNPNDLGYVFRAAEKWALDFDVLEDLDMGFAAMESWAIEEEEWENGIHGTVDHDSDGAPGADNDNNDPGADDSNNDIGEEDNDDMDGDDGTASESGSDTSIFDMWTPSLVNGNIIWNGRFFHPLLRMIRTLDITVVGAELVPSALLLAEGNVSGDSLTAMMVAEMAERAPTDGGPRGKFSTMTLAEWNEVREHIAGPRELSEYVLPVGHYKGRAFLRGLPDEVLESAADFSFLVATPEDDDSLPQPSGSLA